MNPQDVDPILREMLADHRMTRGERRDLRAVVRERGLDDDALAYWRHRAFALAAAELGERDAKQVLEWLEGAIKSLVPPAASAADAGQRAEVHFSPGKACLSCIDRLIRTASRSIDVCVFTLTDDRLAEPLLEAHGRGVAVRIITDNDKSQDRGSDVERLLKKGLAIRMDRSEHHMHHKFALFDGKTVATGSYNWTRSAARYNRENVAVTDDPRLVHPYREAFDTLWRSLE